MRFYTSAAVLAASLFGLVQPAAAQLAQAQSLFSMADAVQVSLSNVESQAQLAQQLKSEGYDNILLSSAAATRENPHPELNPSLANQPDAPVRTGWNGTADKNGTTYQIYVTFAGQ